MELGAGSPGPGNDRDSYLQPTRERSFNREKQDKPRDPDTYIMGQGAITDFQNTETASILNKDFTRGLSRLEA